MRAVARVGTGSPGDRDSGFRLEKYLVITVKIQIVAEISGWEGQGIFMLEGGGILIMAQTGLQLWELGAEKER